MKKATPTKAVAKKAVAKKAAPAKKTVAKTPPVAPPPAKKAAPRRRRGKVNPADLPVLPGEKPWTQAELDEVISDLNDDRARVIRTLTVAGGGAGRADA